MGGLYDKPTDMRSHRKHSCLRTGLLLVCTHNMGSFGSIERHLVAGHYCRHKRSPRYSG